MTPMPPTIHVQLFPTLPPHITPQPEQRLRQLRSPRKLEATIPLFLDLDSKVDITHKAPRVSPRTRAIHRKGQVFHSPSSSMSSIESDYSTDTRSGLNHPQPSPSSSRSSLDIKPVAKESNARSGKSGQVHPGDRYKLRNKSPQILAQPFLLRLRSIPLPIASSIKTGISPVYQSKRLSPVSSSFDMDMTTTTTQTRYVMTESDKRRKLAKLSRTLGENVPPELVFCSPPLQRTASLSVSRPRDSPSSHTISQSVSNPTTNAETSAPHQQSARKPDNPLKQQLRRQSMMLTSQPIATQSAAVDTRSLEDVSAPIDPPFKTATTVDAEVKTRQDIEWGRRKEKEWSGEWNVKDMEHVARALRGLKGR